MVFIVSWNAICGREDDWGLGAILGVQFHMDYEYQKCYIYIILFKNWETSWVSNFAIKFAPLRYNQRQELVSEIILSYMNCRNIIAMPGFMDPIQVRNQIEQIWWRLSIKMTKFPKPESRF